MLTDCLIHTVVPVRKHVICHHYNDLRSMDSPHKGPVMWKVLPHYDSIIIMLCDIGHFHSIVDSKNRNINQLSGKKDITVFARRHCNEWLNMTTEYRYKGSPPKLHKAIIDVHYLRQSHRHVVTFTKCSSTQQWILFIMYAAICSAWVSSGLYLI